MGPAARSLARTPAPASSRLDPQVQDPLGHLAAHIPYLLIFIENLLNSWQSEQNWPIGQIRGKTLQFQRKVVARSVANPVSKLANRSKTGQIWVHKYNRFRALARSVFKTGQKTGQPIRHFSHTNNRIVAHPSYQVVQRVVQQSAHGVVETPLIEDLLDPNRPRNGLIDGRPALQVVVVQD